MEQNVRIFSILLFFFPIYFSKYLHVAIQIFMLHGKRLMASPRTQKSLPILRFNVFNGSRGKERRTGQGQFYRKELRSTKRLMINFFIYH